MGSVGAASAAQTGRGTRISASDDEYQVVLPSLPTGRFVLNTVFLHCDIRARPYRVEDFRDALAQLSLLPEVAALGAYRMSHVWAVTFKDSDAVKKIVSVGELQVKKGRCLVIDPANQDVRLKVHWLLPSVPDEDVRFAFAPFGKVTDVVRERWRVHGVTDKNSTTRLVTLKLKPGVKLDDLPHQVSVAGELALVVVPGRAPLCLRCRGTGHIRRECRIPRCGACRRFGHEDSQCERTYASVTGPVGNEDNSALLMDEADMEDTSTAAGEAADVVAKPAVRLEQEEKQVAQAVFTGHQQATAEGTAAMPNAEEKTPPDAEVTSSLVEPEGMDTLTGPTTQPTGKRPHNQTVSRTAKQDGSGGDEPPPKATGIRRSTLKLRPNVTVDPRQAGKPPP
nr:uncharacterized protein LOC126527469 [Dermacentor andersoni]